MVPLSLLQFNPRNPLQSLPSAPSPPPLVLTPSPSVISGLAQGSGEYFARLGTGTPAKYSYMVLDTGSDVVWIQCTPCRKCYTQADPIFDPSKSSTFLGVTCESTLCRQLDSPGCNSRQKKCLYQVSYGDGSFTAG